MPPVRLLGVKGACLDVVPEDKEEEESCVTAALVDHLYRKIEPLRPLSLKRSIVTRPKLVEGDANDAEFAYRGWQDGDSQGMDGRRREAKAHSGDVGAERRRVEYSR